MNIIKKVNKRSLVTLFVFLAFLIIVATSILMFSQPYDTPVALLHTIIGFSMLLMVVFHLKNNFASLKNHLKLKTRAHGSFNLALPITLFICIGLGLASYFRLPPAEFIYKWGSTLRASEKQVKTKEMTYTLVDRTHSENIGPTITVDVRKGPYFTWPQYAIWIEDMNGNFIQPLYVTSKIAKNNFVNKVTKKDSDVVFNSHVFLSGDIDLAKTFDAGVFPESKYERTRPESLPVFLHKNSKHKKLTKLIPDGDTAIADAYTGASINQSFLFTTNLKTNKTSSYKIRFEINTSFDFNNFYSSDRFPNDPVYSGNGYSAQPSLVYEALIDFTSKQTVYPMYLVGRGHHSGQNGQIYQDLENITTAKEIVDRILVEVTQ